MTGRRSLVHPDGGAIRVGTPAAAAAAATAACLPRLTAPPSLPVPPQLINRMLYRSRQRGFLELDLLIVRAGGWLAGWCCGLGSPGGTAPPTACARCRSACARCRSAQLLHTAGHAA